MKFVLSVFICVFISVFSNAQEFETIIDSSYQWGYSREKPIQNLAPGNYLFHSDIEYIDFFNSDFYNQSFPPVFFSKEEMGIIICSMNVSYAVLGVYETENRIVIILSRYDHGHTESTKKPVFQTVLRLKKSNKKVEFKESVECYSIPVEGIKPNGK